MSSTIDNFQGSPSDYLSYLERTVVSLRQRQNCCRCSSVSYDTFQRDTGTYCTTTSGTRELEIVHFHPRKSPTRETTRKRRKKETPVPRWEEQALTLIGETPKADMWTQKLKEIGIYDVMCSGKAVSHLLLLDVENKPRTASPEDASMAQVLRSSPLSRIEHYARVSVQKEITAAVAMALANYQKFLVLSSCVVLVRMGISTKEIYDVMRICMGNAVTDDHCKRILRGCQFVHELMDTLYMGGWGLRAFELLLVWNKTPTFYCSIAYAYDSALRLLKTELCTRELMADVETTSARWTSIFAPKIIQDILGESIDIAHVAEMLGYRFTYLFKTRVNTWDYEEIPV